MPDKLTVKPEDLIKAAKDIPVDVRVSLLEDVMAQLITHLGLTVEFIPAEDDPEKYYIRLRPIYDEIDMSERAIKVRGEYAQ